MAGAQACGLHSGSGSKSGTGGIGGSHVARTQRSLPELGAPPALFSFSPHEWCQGSLRAFQTISSWPGLGLPLGGSPLQLVSGVQDQEAQGM